MAINWSNWNKIADTFAGGSLCLGEERTLTDSEVEIINTHLAGILAISDQIAVLTKKAREQMQARQR